MDKQTLSNYGWIIVCVLVLATLLAFATPFSNFLARGFEATSAGFAFTAGDTMSNIDDNNPPSLEELQEMYKFDYYSSLALAVDDINAGTIGKNADCNKDNAVAGIYTHKGKNYAVLLKDNTEERKVSPKVAMTINLGGNVLNSDAECTLWCESGSITIDGRLKNSTIKNNQGIRCVHVFKGADVVINKGSYILEDTDINNGLFYCPIGSRGKCTINNANISASGKYNIEGVSTKGSYANVVINNCSIDVYSTSGAANGVTATNKMTINSSKINVASTYYNGTLDNTEASGIVFKTDENETNNKVYVNINNTDFKISSNTLYVKGIYYPTTVAGVPMDLETELNLYNTHIYTVSENSKAFGIWDLSGNNPVINITKSDIVAESHSTKSGITAYGIWSNNAPTITIDRSAILANKHLEGTNTQNSIGISGTNNITNNYSTIFGTKSKIQ